MASCKIGKNGRIYFSDPLRVSMTHEERMLFAIELAAYEAYVEAYKQFMHHGSHISIRNGYEPGTVEHTVYHRGLMVADTDCDHGLIKV